MWTQLKGALRNIILYSLLIVAGLVVYSIFLLRGRDVSCEGPVDPLWRIAGRVDTSWTDHTRQSEHLTYALTKLPDGRYERKITNQSWRPFLVIMYEFENWRYTLPDEMMLRYARRYTIRNTRTNLEIDSGSGFDCGSGLGMTLIRPWETFVDTIGFEELMPYAQLRHQLWFSEDDNTAYDRLTGARIGDPQGDYDQYDEASLLTMVPDDELEVRLYLPVTDYFSGRPARVYADGLTVGRWDMLEREVQERARLQAEFTD